MDKELFGRLFLNEHFRDFCSRIDGLRKRGYKIEIPLETVTLLLDAKVDFVKDIENIEAIHSMVKKFLDPVGRTISGTTLFYDYFVIKNIMWYADRREEIGENRFRILPLDMTEYADSICTFDTCTCGHKPNIIFSNFWNSLTGKVICKKCGLSVSKMFVYDKLFMDNSKDYGEVYVNLQDGIKTLSGLWNKEAAKNESILHRTMRELLSYGSNVCVNPVIYELHEKLYTYMTENGVYRKPEYWNEPGYWDFATDKMMECKEPLQWVEDYLWENMPNRLEV